MNKDLMKDNDLLSVSIDAKGKVEIKTTIDNIKELEEKLDLIIQRVMEMTAISKLKIWKQYLNYLLEKWGMKG